MYSGTKDIDEELWFQSIYEINGFLAKLAKLVSFEIFRSELETIWLFAELLKKNGLEQKLFDRFGAELDRQGFAAKSGFVQDGSFVEVPKQRNTKEENEPLFRGALT